MGTIINIPRKSNVRLLATLAIPWLLVGILPWAAWLDGLPWLRLALAGLIFIAPGVAISLCLIGKRFTLLSHFTTGLALSVFLVSLLAMLGRIANLPFGFIRPTVFVAGLIAFTILSIRARSKEPLYKPANASPASILLILLIVILCVVVSFTKRFGTDDFTYLAHLTNWEHSQRLDFRDVVFGKGDLESVRDWLEMFPMDEAFLAQLSNLHGLLLIGYYLGPVLIVAALLATYNLYEDLLRSDRQAVSALLIQVVFLFLLLDTRQPGNVFFLRITEDKAFAAFVLAPVFFLAVRCFLESRAWSRGILVLLTGWSLALVHPIILAYSIFIAGVYAAIVMVARKDYKTLGVVLPVLAVVILPVALFRFLPLPEVGTPPFDLESALGGASIGDMISFIKGTPFYGLNVHQILRIPLSEGGLASWRGFLSWSYLWLLGLGFLWSLYELRRQEPAAPFVVASALLVLLCAIPYTGWAVGYFVSARMLWRSPWLFPIGLAGARLAEEAFRAMSSRLAPRSRWEAFTRHATSISVLAVCVVVAGYFSVYHYQTRWSALKALPDYRIRLERQVELGEYLETNIEQPSIFLASYNLMNYLPGLSSKAKVVYFRAPHFNPYPVDRAEIGRVLSADTDFSLEQRLEVLRKYDVRYLLTTDASLEEFYAAYPQFFNLQKVGRYWLLELRESALRN